MVIKEYNDEGEGEGESKGVEEEDEDKDEPMHLSGLLVKAKGKQPAK